MRLAQSVAAWPLPWKLSWRGFRRGDVAALHGEDVGVVQKALRHGYALVRQLRQVLLRCAVPHLRVRMECRLQNESRPSCNLLEGATSQNRHSRTGILL